MNGYEMTMKDNIFGINTSNLNAYDAKHTEIYNGTNECN